MAVHDGDVLGHHKGEAVLRLRRHHHLETSGGVVGIRPNGGAVNAVLQVGLQAAIAQQAHEIIAVGGVLAALRQGEGEGVVLGAADPVRAADSQLGDGLFGCFLGADAALLPVQTAAALPGVVMACSGQSLAAEGAGGSIGTGWMGRAARVITDHPPGREGQVPGGHGGRDLLIPAREGVTGFRRGRGGGDGRAIALGDGRNGTAAGGIKGDGVRVHRPLGREGQILRHGVGEVILFPPQIPAAEGMAGLGGGGGLCRLTAVGDGLCIHRTASIVIKGHGIAGGQGEVVRFERCDFFSPLVENIIGFELTGRRRGDENIVFRRVAHPEGSAVHDLERIIAVERQRTVIVVALRACHLDGQLAAVKSEVM